MQAQQLRASFQALVVNHHPQRPVSGRSNARRPAQQRAALPSRAMREWALAAVRADQVAETSDTSTIQLIADITKGVEEQHGAVLAATAAAVAAGPPAHPDSDLRRKVMASILDLQTGLLERETEVRGGSAAAQRRGAAAAVRA
jgi:hypothetical protein